jgi:hypothetical protein
MRPEDFPGYTPLCAAYAFPVGTNVRGQVDGVVVGVVGPYSVNVRTPAGDVSVITLNLVKADQGDPEPQPEPVAEEQLTPIQRALLARRKARGEG